MLAQDDIKNKLITCTYTPYYTNIVIHCTLVLPVQIFLCLSQIKPHFLLFFQFLLYQARNFLTEKCIHNSPTLQLSAGFFLGRKPDLLKDTQWAKVSFLHWLLAFVKLSKKPTMWLPRDTNDFINAKGHARKKPLLAGYLLASLVFLLK